MTVRRPLYVLLVILLVIAAAIPAVRYVAGLLEQQAEENRRAAARVVDGMQTPVGFNRQSLELCAEYGETLCLRHSGEVADILTPVVQMLAAHGDLLHPDTIFNDREKIRVPLRDGSSTEVSCTAPQLPQMKVKYDNCFVYAEIEGATVVAFLNSRLAPGTFRYSGSETSITVLDESTSFP